MTADVSSGWRKLGSGLFCGFGLLPSASLVGKSPRFDALARLYCRDSPRLRNPPPSSRTAHS